MARSTRGRTRGVPVILLRHSEKDTWHRGHYKTNSHSVAAFDENGVQIGIVFQTATPFDTPRLMTRKEAYYLALRHTQGTIRTGAPNWQPWLEFFLRSLAEQVRRLEKKVEREKLVLPSLPGLSLQIVECAREHGRVTMGEAIRLTGASRNTLKQHFRNLVERGYLNQHGSGRGVWYELR